MISLPEFKAQVRLAVLALPPAPEGFSFGDLARRLGGLYCDEDAPDRQRLRRWVNNHHGGPLLASLGRGRYAAGPDLHLEGAAGVAAQLVGDIRAAFDEAGGVLSFADLLNEIGREGDGTLVRRVLNESGAYQSGSAIPGYLRAWSLVDAERVKLPVPGKLIAFDIQMAAGGPRPRDLPRFLRRRHEQIAAGLGEAREMSGVTGEQIVSLPKVANALDAALRYSVAKRYAADGRHEALSAWWRDELERKDRLWALTTAWELMEQGDAAVLGSTTVRLWRETGRALGFCPALLSRGCVVRTRSTLGS